MTRDDHERRISQKDEPDLYEHLESLLFSGAKDVELQGKTFDIAKDKGEQGCTYYVLTPVPERQQRSR